MGLFKTKAEKEMDDIIRRLEMNMSNNYKDNAQSNLKELEACVDRLRSSGELKASRLAGYESLLGVYKEKLKGFTHKDQKPYWT
ncbi:MAG: hypothetical protein ILP13_02320 [Lachnospiraceae bacterium]|nr:hypothetical protein [Lachnospiraceae bacterium]